MMDGAFSTGERRKSPAARRVLECIVSIDQGTQSTRSAIYDKKFRKVGDAQAGNTQIYLQPGWCEHDPAEIYSNVVSTLEDALAEAQKTLGPDTKLLVRGIGLTNQRETVVVWNRKTGIPYHNAIVWLDTRTTDVVNDLIATHGSANAFQNDTGLPINTYFSAVKVKWLMENYPKIKNAITSGEACIGTMDSWVIYNLTARTVFATDLTNASRTLLFDLNTGNWSEKLMKIFEIPLSCLPEIKPNCEMFGEMLCKRLPEYLKGLPICGVIGDQQGACFGQRTMERGDLKCTYGTGAFILMNTGEGKPFISKTGLLTTPLYQISESEPVMWGLEGAISTAGSGITWLQEELRLFASGADSEKLAASVEDSGGVYLVPAFSGLFAPRWRKDARGIIAGITNHTSRAHITRAMLEAVAFQLNEIIEAMVSDMKFEKKKINIKADGGMTRNCLLMQLCSDITGAALTASVDPEVTCLGAAMCAAIGCSMYADLEELATAAPLDTRKWEPKMDTATRNHKVKLWNHAVEKSYDSACFVEEP